VEVFAGNPVLSPAVSADGMIYVGSGNDRHLYAINPDGALKWKFTTGVIQAIASPSIGPDGTIYFGSDDGNL
jgi:outer membrane protein assembly factor BamB